MSEARSETLQTEEEASPASSLTVSRQSAAAYEEYDLWYENERNLFGALGLFTGEVLGPKNSNVPVRERLSDPSLKSSVESLRNPVHRCVEFYATTILSGALDEALPLQIDAPDEDSEDSEDPGESEESDDSTPDNSGEENRRDKASPEKLREAMEEFWEWSNLAQNLPVFKRHVARYGQCFIKVVKPEDKDYCYAQFVKPQHVTDFECDPRGNITYIRLDVPKVRTNSAGLTRKLWASEVWRKGEKGKSGYALFGESPRTSWDTVPSEEVLKRSGERRELGSDRGSGYRFDFVPFVACNARNTGEKRPRPVYAHGLVLIAWVCREATRLSDLMFRFNKAFKVIFGMGNDASGRPIPPPKPGNVKSLDDIQREREDEAMRMRQGDYTVPFGGSRGSVLQKHEENISIEGIAVTGLPGTAQMADATPNINYEAARQWISDHLREITEELPELLYYSTESRANQSGAALRTLIGSALDRANEMRSNMLAALVKADKMGLTVSQVSNLEGFSPSEIGTYENGDFEHDFEPGEILPLTEEEREAGQGVKLQNAQSLMALLSSLGVSREEQRKVILTELGHEDLIDTADEGSSPEEAEGNPSRQELAASGRALTARLDEQGPGSSRASGMQTPASPRGDGG